MDAVRERLPTTGFGFLRLVDESFGFNRHYHPEYELSLITEGSGTRFMGDRVDEFGPRDLVLIGSNVSHTWASNTPVPAGAGMVVHFTRDFVGEPLLARADAHALRELLEPSHGALGFRASGAAVRAFNDLEAAAGLHRLLRLLDILLELSRAQRRALCGPAGSRPHEHTRRRIDDVCGFLHENCTQPLPIAKAAEVAHMTPGSFSRFFRRAMGRSFTGYLNELRVARACALLSGTDLPIARVAAESGFTNLANFNRRFRELRETTPRAYRRIFSGEAAGNAEGR
ncbi:MAG: AraC family transcriptional regulator [Gaiellaceae bacterium MAG52_C11]|nr:AraC family transcriptional regulator [Candidatus Gaiellasilicea maunaloa]